MRLYDLKKDAGSFYSFIRLKKLYRLVFLTSFSIRLNWIFFYYMRTYFFLRIYKFFFGKFKRDIYFRRRIKKLLYLLYSNYKDSFFNFDYRIYSIRGARCFFVHDFICRNFFMSFLTKQKYFYRSAGLRKQFSSGGAYRRLRHSQSNYIFILTKFFLTIQGFLHSRINIIFKSFSTRIPISIRLYINFFRLANKALGSKTVRFENIFLRRGRQFGFIKSGLKTGRIPARKRYLSRIRSKNYY